MRSVIVAVLVLGLVAAQSMQREHVIEVVQAKAAITEAQNEVSPAIEDTKKVESETEAKVEENVEPANPFARPEDIKNSKPPMNYEEIFDMKNGEAYPESGESPKFKRERDHKSHPRYKNQRPSRVDDDQEDMGFDSGLILPVLVGLAVVIFLVKICTKRGKCNKRRLRNRMQRASMQTNQNNSIQLQSIEPIDQSIQFHQSEIKRLKNAYRNLSTHSQQLQ